MATMKGDRTCSFIAILASFNMLSVHNKTQ